jgi:hypothetical protein
MHSCFGKREEEINLEHASMFFGHDQRADIRLRSVGDSGFQHLHLRLHVVGTTNRSPPRSASDDVVLVFL